MVVLPSFTCVGDLVPVSAVSVARWELESPGMGRHFPDHLEDIVVGSHPSLGSEGWMTGRTTPVQHEIVTTDAWSCVLTFVHTYGSWLQKHVGSMVYVAGTVFCYIRVSPGSSTC